MFNMVKMELYRMFRAKSLYVIWLIMSMVIIFSTSMARLEQDMMQEGVISEQELNQSIEEQSETVNIGMSVLVPTAPGADISVFDCFYANIQAKMIALFLVIFTVIFSTADMNSGYIKNIGGQVKNRGNLVFAKAVTLIIYTILSILLAFAVQILGNAIFLRYIVWGNVAELVKYLGIQIVLHTAFVLISMAISIILRNNVISMIVVICLCLNLAMLAYGAIEMFIQKLGIKNFSIIEHTVTGKMSLLPMSPTTNDCVSSIIIGTVFGIIFALASAIVFKKRDI